VIRRVAQLAFCEALVKWAYEAPTASDIALARTGIDPDLVKNVGGTAELLLGTRKIPRLSFKRPDSLWAATEGAGRQF
jgi:hypothetical protein